MLSHFLLTVQYQARQTIRLWGAHNHHSQIASVPRVVRLLRLALQAIRWTVAVGSRGPNRQRHLVHVVWHVSIRHAPTCCTVPVAKPGTERSPGRWICGGTARAFAVSGLASFPSPCLCCSPDNDYCPDGKRGAGISNYGLATSTDGVHWTDEGISMTPWSVNPCSDPKMNTTIPVVRLRVRV